MEQLNSITIDLSHIQEGLELYVDARKDNTLYIADDAFDNNEAIHQLIEGFSYDYEFSDKAYTFAKDQIVQPHTRNKYIGTISPNIYVGTLSVPVFHNNIEVTKIELEVQSVKAGYRNDYRDMLELITEKCTDLLMQANSPVSHHFDIDYSKDSQSLYQKFAFIKSVISSEEFSESIHRIVSAPVTKWKEVSEQKDIRNIRRFKNSNIREFITGSKRTRLPDNHYLQSYGLNSLPEKLSSVRKTDTVDTSENRFVKHALEVFLKFSSDINKSAKPESKLERESFIMMRDLEEHLHHSVFKEITRPTTLKLNSPVLQRKEGYREVLRAWLMFDLAAKLIWQGGDDVYGAGKKDIATLYEYWLFFKLLDLFKDLFDIKPKDVSDLIKETKDGLNLQLKQGSHTALRGVFNSGTRKLNIKFNYNRSFGGKKDYPHSGSWTTTMRPDYTLSFWPQAINEKEAEEQELIVHIHFDAKYKIANLTDLLPDTNSENLSSEKEENRKGIYKNADLLKMHAYKDAIRRTGGAYVLYPGEKSISRKGFHEIIPGLGAFPLRPSKADDGASELKQFILEVIEHFVNRASQREKLAYKVYDIHKDGKPNELRESIPETYGVNRGLIPDETFVLIGYYKYQEQLDWIISNKKYNFRMGSGNCSLELNNETVTSKYLLLHSHGDDSSNKLWKIVSKGPKVYSKGDLENKSYPNPSHDSYLIFDIEEVDINEFNNVSWKFKELSNFKGGRQSSCAFTTTLTELMKVVK